MRVPIRHGAINEAFAARSAIVRARHVRRRLGLVQEGRLGGVEFGLQSSSGRRAWRC